MRKQERDRLTDLLKTTAEAIGSTLGKLASKTGIATAPPPRAKKKRIVATTQKRTLTRLASKKPVRTLHTAKRT
jgi:hypothetical protein